MANRVDGAMLGKHGRGSNAYRPIHPIHPFTPLKDDPKLSPQTIPFIALGSEGRP
ncbi:MAG: hypothetical protein F6J95_000930 [Leptolyngbya sp. SIO1E4]|nr:hypothetical protein [Leptolyngbya sp. SIO1E4]